MSVLGKNILVKHGPYNCFSVVDNPINEINLSKKTVFIEFAEDLIGAYCSMTKSYAPFDLHYDTQFEKPYDIYEFTAKLLQWEWQLARTPENYFKTVLDYIDYPSTTIKAQKYKPEQLKVDMLETLHYMIGEMHKAAATGKCLHIEGL
jgi:hypothetical protein